MVEGSKAETDRQIAMGLAVTEPVGESMQIPFLGGLSRGLGKAGRVPLTVGRSRDGRGSRRHNIGSGHRNRHAVGANIGPRPQGGLHI